ncbi:acetate kinase [Rickenella mellea]|uniref:Probable acetate kinase n=1 Tax=Rickenella mellea TaxID=50990 RepID=A0A4Y7PS49_9AGAM|nr:acetate kinase [Rickenella mellea]TDL17389.1 acetate kinase [Rickenella mellea]
MRNSRNLILSLNAGSSSLKISIFRPTGLTDSISTEEPVSRLLNASLSNLSSPPVHFSFSCNAPISHTQEFGDEIHGVRDHESGFEYFLSFLQRETSLEKDDIAHVCHRVVHGGDYSGPVLISEESYHHIESLSDLAPLHNGAALTVIKACLKILPASNSIAYFDSSFHATIPAHISTYLIDTEIAKQKNLKKYGFHGLSYEFILRTVAQHLSKPISETNLIVMHLGAGASVCVIKDGKSLDTSMGLTPVDGLPGATRSGAIDPSLIFHYTSAAGKISHSATGSVHVTEAEDILNRRSGWEAVAGTTDFGEIVHGAFLHPPLHKYQLAFDIFVDRIINYLGSYFLKLGGSAHLDALVFSGGIGERSKELRASVIERCECLGFKLDARANQNVNKAVGNILEIGKSEGGAKVLVCNTDEQLEMARQCAVSKGFGN